MASSALDWCSLAKLKGHMNFERDENGQFITTEQDGKLVDSIHGAVKWCESRTNLPLLGKTHRVLIDRATIDEDQTILVAPLIDFKEISACLLYTSPSPRD